MVSSILITTSRRTSNRIRTFVRDLYSLVPNSIRFNRGGMSLAELTSRITQLQAKAAMIITTFRGNPGKILFLEPNGIFSYELFLESALLRREIPSSTQVRVKNLRCIALEETQNQDLLHFAQYLSELLGIPLQRIRDIHEVKNKSSGDAFLLLKYSGNKFHWTAYHTYDKVELGPRIRISTIRRPLNEG